MPAQEFAKQGLAFNPVPLLLLADTGQGIATGALSELIRLTFTELNLHRLQGETLVDNRASQHVLTRCGFSHYGTAPSYLRVEGHWQTHELYQLINDHWSE